MIIQNGLVFTENFTFEPLTVKTKKDRIVKLCAPNTEAGTSFHIPASASLKATIIPDDATFDASGCLVLPGLTDIHFHGCMGHDFCEGTKEALETIAAFSLSKGVTSICPATMTLPKAELSRICKTAADFAVSQQTTSATADLIGIHMEGPFINAHKKGAQNEAYVQAPSPSLLRDWQEDAKGLIKLVSLAPELTGAIDCIKECHDAFHFSVAHTEADYETAMEAFQKGADHVTHLYNAMPPFTHRAPGVIGAAFDSPGCFVEIICDGVHIAPSAVRAAFRLFGKERMVLISDSMEATGKPDGTYSLGGLSVNVRDNRATLSDGTLAGSVTPLYECMHTAVSMGIPLTDAVRAATINPCRSIGMDNLYGSISPDKKAHFLILDKEDLSIRAVIKNQLLLCFS
ncbi:MAG: N-acetylglucosamine-6-phosphate deacetylase [Lachnospiraceae bacterium]|nr:N-acetylglucosamine-6-phosphate deacetylase [Lachnospiraceae bacterium]